MYLIYNLLLLILSLVSFPLVIIFFIMKPKLRAGFWQKIGCYKRLNSTKPTIWIHAVSVGEVNAVEQMIKRLYKEMNNYNLVLTTVTKTGQDMARKKLANYTYEIIYFPYEFLFSILIAISVIKPKLVVVAETEIWPNFSYMLNKKKIPLVMINGRISPNSYKGYKKIKYFIKTILNKYTLMLMQSKDDKTRIINLGATPSKVELMGNLKFDIEPPLSDQEIIQLKENLNINNNTKVLIAGSTHKGEDEIILGVYKKLLEEITDLKLILAPRHPERLSNVESLITSFGFKYEKRSKERGFNNNNVILVDTMGELGKLYSVSDIAFIGGSFSGTGGHNPLEPAIYNVPVITGNSIFNFKDIYKFMLENKSAILVNKENELYLTIKKLMSNDKIYSEISLNCQKVFKHNRGAIDYCIDKIKSLTPTI